jgi:protoporphyrinogen oxidase
MNVAIIGGGLSGLTIAYDLQRRGVKVDVFEKESEIGGMTRSMNVDGYIFDLGPHIFHTKIVHIRKFIEDILGNDLIHEKFYGSIFLDGRLHDYPPTFKNLLRFPSFKLATAFCGHVTARLRTKSEKRSSDLSFEDWVIAKAGRGLYETYFAGYTRKLWGINPSHITSEWAPERISVRLLSRSFFGNEWQVYPRFGIGMLPNKLGKMVSSLGGTIHTNNEVTDFTVAGDKIREIFFKDGKNIGRKEADAVVSTIPITELSELLENRSLRLKFRSIVCIFLTIDKPRVLDKTHWVYFPSKEAIFNRVYEPKRFSPSAVPSPDKTSLCVECTCSLGDSTWNMKEDELVDAVSRQLEEYNIVKKEYVTSGRVIRVPYAYPVNEIGYVSETNHIFSKLSNFENLVISGRYGSFLYLNMDATMKNAFDVAERVHSMIGPIS